MIRLTPNWFRPAKFTPCRPEGMLRLLPTRAKYSPPCRGARNTDCPVAASLRPLETEYVNCRLAGNSRVLMSTCAPLKSPCRSGVNVLEVVIDWMMPLGKRSSGTTLRSGSGLGMRAPLSDAVV